jgi:hypothetical protein
MRVVNRGLILMKFFTKLAASSTVALVVGAVSASAAVIDFTDNGVSTGPGTEGGGWTLTGSPVFPNTDEVGPGAVGGLVGDNDGLGIRNDEITGPQYVTITFNKVVTLTGFKVLDLYISNQNSDNYETALVSIGSVPDTPADASLAAAEIVGGGFGLPGYGSQTTSLKGTSFTFFVGPANPGVGSGGTGNDDVAQRDYALAAVEISAVPLPAGMVLFGTALGGLGLMRRRKQK